MILWAGEQLINQVEFFVPVCFLKHSVQMRVGRAAETESKLGAMTVSTLLHRDGTTGLKDPAVSGSQGWYNGSVLTEVLTEHDK